MTNRTVTGAGNHNQGMASSHKRAILTGLQCLGTLATAKSSAGLCVEGAGRSREAEGKSQMRGYPELSASIAS